MGYTLTIISYFRYLKNHSIDINKYTYTYISMLIDTYISSQYH